MKQREGERESVCLCVWVFEWLSESGEDQTNAEFLYLLTSEIAQRERERNTTTWVRERERERVKIWWKTIWEEFFSHVYNMVIVWL